MDQANMQTLLALTCVAVAVGVLVRRLVMMIRHPAGSGCHAGGCQGCPSKSLRKTDGFVSLDQLMEAKKH